MINGKTIAVVVPAYNEESQIHIVLETMPDFVDRIVIVNDCSKDATSEKVLSFIKNNSDTNKTYLPDITGQELPKNLYNHAERVLRQQAKEEKVLFTPSKVINTDDEHDRVILIEHTQNGGVGASIASGYKWCKDHKVDCTAVMAGDGQMDPAELEGICLPVIDENIDYVKGNRLIHRSAWLVIPKVRYFGNSILSILTKIASGYWHISDTQTGYTALSNSALNAIELHKIYKSYGMPNDMLVKLNIAFCTLKEVEIKPIYNVGEESKMRIFKVIPTVSWLLTKSFFKRLWIKYLFRDFHPLFLLYNLSFLLFGFSIPGIIRIIKYFLLKGIVTPDNVVVVTAFTLISSMQFLLFAMWMDIQDNERLYK